MHAPCPKTLYAGGKYTGLMLFICRWFSDWILDRAIMSFVK